MRAGDRAFDNRHHEHLYLACFLLDSRTYTPIKIVFFRVRTYQPISFTWVRTYESDESGVRLIALGG